MKYFSDSVIFEPFLKDLLHERNPDWSKSSAAKSFLCISEGPKAEKFSTKTKCNTKVSFSTNYETGVIGYMKSQGLLAIKDKGTCAKIFKEERFIVPSDNFFYMKSGFIKTFLKKHSGIKKFVVKPSYFSHSNEGVLVTTDAKEAMKFVSKYGVKFPQWIIQEYIQSKTEIPHYLKIDLFLVKNRVTRELELYFSHKIMYFGHRNVDNVEQVINFTATKNLFKENKNVKIKGQSYISAEKKFNSLFGKTYYNRVLIPQLRTVCAKILKAIKYSDINCYSKNLFCCQYMSMDMILDHKDILRLIEINIVPTHHFPQAFKMPKGELGNKMKKIYPRLRHGNYVSDLLNDMLSVTIDTIVPPNKRFDLKFLHKAIRCGDKKSKRAKRAKSKRAKRAKSKRAKRAKSKKTRKNKK
jgi:hypothetical protein